MTAGINRRAGAWLNGERTVATSENVTVERARVTPAPPMTADDDRSRVVRRLVAHSAAERAGHQPLGLGVVARLGLYAGGPVIAAQLWPASRADALLIVGLIVGLAVVDIRIALARALDRLDALLDDDPFDDELPDDDGAVDR